MVAATALGLAPPPDDASDERVPQSAEWTSHRAVCAAAAFDWCGNGFGPFLRLLLGARHLHRVRGIVSDLVYAFPSHVPRAASTCDAIAYAAAPTGSSTVATPCASVVFSSPSLAPLASKSVTLTPPRFLPSNRVTITTFVVLALMAGSHAAVRSVTPRRFVLSPST